MPLTPGSLLEADKKEAHILGEEVGLFAFAQCLSVIKNGIASDTDHPASTGPHR